MAEQQKPQKQQDAKPKKVEQVKARPQQREELLEQLIRIFGYDIPGQKNLVSGLTRIKGISWAISNAICLNSKIPKSKKISELSKDEIKVIESHITNLVVPEFMKNRQKDPETGKSEHHYSSDLDMKKNFDIKRLKKIKSYRGLRHSTGQPTRGQRTKSHFRTKKKKGSGIASKTVRVSKDVKDNKGKDKK